MTPAERERLLEQVRGIEAAGRLASQASRKAGGPVSRAFHEGAAQAYLVTAAHLRRRLGL